MEKEFGARVIDAFVDSYLEGSTPNPCQACNQYIKFDELLRRGLAAYGAERVATEAQLGGIGETVEIAVDQERVAPGGAHLEPVEETVAIGVRRVDGAAESTFVIVTENDGWLDFHMVESGHGPNSTWNATVCSAAKVAVG